MEPISREPGGRVARRRSNTVVQEQKIIGTVAATYNIQQTYMLGIRHLLSTNVTFTKKGNSKEHTATGEQWW